MVQSRTPNLRFAAVDDAKAIGALMEEYLQSRLAGLGPRFLTHLCEHIVASPMTICHVAEQAGVVLGFVIIITDTRAFYRRFLRTNAVRSAWLALPYIFRIRNLRTVLNSLSYFSRAPVQDPPAELVAFVVSSELQGQGVGHALYAEVVGAFAARGHSQFKVCTPVDNEVANRFYRRQGARYVRREPFNEHVDANVYYVDVAARRLPPTADPLGDGE